MQANIAMLFPGQGSQSIGMLADYASKYPIVEQTFALASEICGKNLWHKAQHGLQTMLDDTTITQPVMLAADITIWRCWQEEGMPAPSLLAGHSLGEYSALVYAKVISLETALILVQKRANYMSQAQPEGFGAVAVIVGACEANVAYWCLQVETAQQKVSIANLNSPAQLVIAGHVNVVNAVLTLAKKNKVKLATKIPVSVAVHCELMRGAASELKKDLAKVNFAIPDIPIIFNIDALIHYDTNEIRHALFAQLYSPVQWLKTMELIVSKNQITIIECGPKGVLSRLIKRSFKEANFELINLNLVSAMPKKSAS